MAGLFTEITDAVVDTTRQLILFELFQKVFVVNGPILGVVDFINTRLDLGAGNELTTPPLAGDVLTQEIPDATALVEYVDATKRYIYGSTTAGVFDEVNSIVSNDAGANTMDPATATPDVVTEIIKLDLGAGNELTTPPLAGDTLTQATTDATMTVAYVDTTKRYIYGAATGVFNAVNVVTSDDAGANTMDPADFVPAVVSDATEIDLGAGNELTTPPLAGDLLTQAIPTATMVVDFVDTDKRYIYGYAASGIFDVVNDVSSGDEGGQAMDPADFVPETVSEPEDMPHWYLWTSHPSTPGGMPEKAYLGYRYNGRAVLAGNPDSPHQWHMSRQGDQLDWDFTAADAQSPVAGQDVDAGVLGDVIRALIPYHDDYLIFGCSNSIYWLQGDPMSGGSMATVSDDTGIFGANSWCWTDGGTLYFWGANGVYKWILHQAPVCISQINLPDLVKDSGANPSTHGITFGWDKRRGGIVIAITKLADGTNTNYFLGIQTEIPSFFPEVYPAACGAYSMLSYDANDPSTSGLLLGCTDGYVRAFDDDANSDDAGDTDEAIDSHVALGPFPITDDLVKDGLVSSPRLELSGGRSGGSQVDSDNTTVSMFTDISAEGLVESVVDGGAPKFSFVASGPGARRGKVKSHTASGRFACVRIRNSTKAKSWAMEQLILHVGTLRKKISRRRK